MHISNKINESHEKNNIVFYKVTKFLRYIDTLFNTIVQNSTRLF